MAITYSFPGVDDVANSTDLRRDLAGLVAQDVDGNVRAGIWPTHLGALLRARADMYIDILEFRAVLNRDGGALFIANDEATPTDEAFVAPAEGLTRIDVVWVRQNETELGDDDDRPTSGILKGIPSTNNPQKPVLNVEGAIEFGTVRIPYTATSTQSAGVQIETSPQYTASAGAPVFVRNLEQLNAWRAPNNSIAVRLDTGREYRRVGGAWVDRRTRDRKVAIEGGSILRGAQRIELASWTRTFGVGTDVSVETGCYFYWPANAAGQFLLLVDGVIVDQARWHSHNKNAMAIVTKTLEATVGAGQHTISVAVASDSTSVNSEVWDGNSLLRVYS